MLRVVIGAVLCGCCVYVGYGIKRHYVVRAKLFIDLLSFLDRLIDEISFLKPPLKVIVSEFTSTKGELSKILAEYLLVIDKSGHISADMLKRTSKSLYITSHERELLSSMLISLGTLDSVTQIHNLNNYKTRFTAISHECDGKNKTIGALAFKLGILAGVLAMIMVA